MKENDEEQIAALLRLAGPRPRISVERAARVHENVYKEWQRGVRRRTRVRMFAMAAAAMVMIVAAALLVPRASKPVSPVAPITIAEVQAIRGTTNPLFAPAAKITQKTWIETFGESSLSLAWNGATLRLDEGTRLRFDSPRTATLERGAIYFDGAQSRITIRTPLGVVRDIGTQFEVRLHEQTLRVRVREGRVDLRRRNEHVIADAPAELVASASGITRNPIAVSGTEWRWVEEAAPPVRLEGLTLREAIVRVAREKGLRVELHGVAGDIRLRGKTGFTPDEALEAATEAASVSYRIEDDTLIVSGRR